MGKCGLDFIKLLLQVALNENYSGLILFCSLVVCIVTTMENGINKCYNIKILQVNIIRICMHVVYTYSDFRGLCACLKLTYFVSVLGALQPNSGFSPNSGVKFYL